MLEVARGADMFETLMNETHAMVDLETLGTGPDAVTAQIGVVLFKPIRPREQDHYGIIENKYLELHVDIADCVRCGQVMDPTTVLWWLRQPREAQEYVFGSKRRNPLGEALGLLNVFLGTGMHREVKKIWSHGATFDLVILQEAYRLTGVKPGFNFRNARDTRTLFDMAGDENIWGDYEDLGERLDYVDKTPGLMNDNEKAYRPTVMEDFGPKHGALPDAVRQAVVVQGAHDNLLGTRIGKGF